MLGRIYKCVLLDFYRHREISEHLQSVCKMTLGSCLKMNQILESIERKLEYLTGFCGELQDYPHTGKYLETCAECLKHECCILLKDLLICYIHKHDVDFAQ